jgi:hypothetical protein
LDDDAIRALLARHAQASSRAGWSRVDSDALDPRVDIGAIAAWVDRNNGQVTDFPAATAGGKRPGRRMERTGERTAAVRRFEFSHDALKQPGSGA